MITFLLAIEVVVVAILLTVVGVIVVVRLNIIYLVSSV